MLILFPFCHRKPGLFLTINWQKQPKIAKNGCILVIISDGHTPELPENFRMALRMYWFQHCPFILYLQLCIQHSRGIIHGKMAQFSILWASEGQVSGYETKK